MRDGAPTAEHLGDITVAETEQQEHYRVNEAGIVLVPLKLAHPLGKAYVERVQAEPVRDYKVGETIWVARDWGNALIDAGQIQVDPIDKKARQRALFLNHRNQSLTATEIDALVAKEAAAAAEAEGAGGDADAATGAKAEGHQSAATTPSKARSAAK